MSKDILKIIVSSLYTGKEGCLVLTVSSFFRYHIQEKTRVTGTYIAELGIRIMFLGLPDPDPLVMDPDLDPSLFP
jgi:hypothetical protein